MDALKPLQELLENLNVRLSAVEARLDGGPVAVATASGSASATTAASSAASVAPAVTEDLAPQIEAYDEYVATYLPPFVNVSRKLGEDAAKLGDVTERAFAAQRAYLVMASKCKKPASPNMEMLKDLQQCLKEANSLRDNRSEFANHQNMVNEGIQALGWLCVEPAPKPFIESYVGGSDFWGNKIRVQFKATNPDQVEFVATFKALLNELMVYVKAHHTTGVTWNPRGVDSAKYTPSTPSKPATGGVPAAAASAPKGPAGGMQGVFAGIRGIDQSGGKTAGLKKVTKDKQTWRKEYNTGDAVPAAAAPSSGPKKTVVVEVKKPAKQPKCEERNGNWYVEHQTRETSPVTLKDLNIKQQVYVFGCDDAVLILEGKAKNIVLDSCKGTKLLFDSVVSSIEIVNCKKVQVQCKGKVPSASIDKTDGCLLHLSWDAKDVQLVTSKSSEMNVAFPASPESEEYVEKPIPEQFVHRITAENAVTSEVSDLYSH